MRPDPHIEIEDVNTKIPITNMEVTFREHSNTAHGERLMEFLGPETFAVHSSKIGWARVFGESRYVAQKARA
jgi:hypothetical protein